MAYSNWDQEEDDEEFNSYGRHDITPCDWVGYLPPDRIVMRASPNKITTSDPHQVSTWFTEVKQQLQEEADYPWWPQVLPLTEGEGDVADENAERLARRLVVSWRWIKQFKGVMICPLAPTILNISQFLDETNC